MEAVSNVQRAVSSKSTLAALEGILLKTTTNGDLKLCGYDLELGITTVIEAQVDEPGEVVLSARLFGDIVRRPVSSTHLSFFSNPPHHTLNITLYNDPAGTCKKRRFVFESPFSFRNILIYSPFFGSILPYKGETGDSSFTGFFS